MMVVLPMLSLTKMYEKWIEDDTEDLKVTKDQIKEIQDRIAAVKSSQNTHESALAEKELILAGKEDVLSVRCQRQLVVRRREGIRVELG